MQNNHKIALASGSSLTSCFTVDRSRNSLQQWQALNTRHNEILESNTVFCPVLARQKETRVLQRLFGLRQHCQPTWKTTTHKHHQHLQRSCWPNVSSDTASGPLRVKKTILIREPSSLRTTNLSSAQWFDATPTCVWHRHVGSVAIELEPFVVTILQSSFHFGARPPKGHHHSGSGDIEHLHSFAKKANQKFL